PAGGQVVFHLHVHVIPRREGVQLKPPASFKEEPATLSDHALKLSAALKGGATSRNPPRSRWRPTRDCAAPRGKPSPRRAPCCRREGPRKIARCPAVAGGAVRAPCRPASRQTG